MLGGTAHHTAATSIFVSNNAGMPLYLHWVHPHTEELVLQRPEPLIHLSTQKIESYSSHVFRLVSVDGTKSVDFTVGEFDMDVSVHHADDLHVIIKSIVHSTARDMSQRLEGCLTEYPSAGALGGPVSTNLQRCMEAETREAVYPIAKTLKEVQKIKRRMATKMRDYVCANTSVETTPPMHTSTWAYEGKEYNVNHVFDAEGVKIKTIDGFVSDEECEFFMSAAESKLARTTISDENGKAVSSTTRKASAAYVAPQRSWSRDTAAKVQDRIFAFTNAVTDLRLKVEGQEGFSVIKYDPSDEYMQHCDGACDGTKHKEGGRVATAVMYCKAAQVGGYTTFSHADVVVRPTKNQATFFSYIDDQGRMDPNALSTHSGCPIVEGEKWIMTQWMRKGVSKERSWSSFSPQGVPVNV